MTLGLISTSDWLRSRCFEKTSHSHQTVHAFFFLDASLLHLACIASPSHWHPHSGHFLLRFRPWFLTTYVPLHKSTARPHHVHSLVLLVVLVPEIVASKYVSTTLGAHKAVRRVVICTRNISTHIEVFSSSNKLDQPFSKPSLVSL